MKNRKQYELVEINGKFRAAVVGSDPVITEYLSADNKESAQKEVEEMNATYNLSDYALEEIEEFWQSLDLTPVNEFFSKLLNLPVNIEKQKTKDYRDSICYALEDKTNIAAQSAITAAAWEEMYVQSFGCAISANKENGELYFWASMHLAYRHHGGGTNGATIGSVWFRDGVWIIKSQKER